MNGEPQSNYVSVNGLEMYYEDRGAGQPLVLLHGAFSAIGTSFGSVLLELAETRRVIAFEMQAHGRTADIESPLSMEQMADDGVAVRVALRHPEMVRKLVLASVTYRLDGVQPGLMEGLGEMKPEMMHGSRWHEEYVRIAPRPGDFATLFAKKTQMDQNIEDLPADAVEAIEAPTLLVIGDSDIVRPEHAVEMFRLLGGGVMGDLAGLPKPQLAILPGTTHATLVDRAAWLTSMVT